MRTRIELEDGQRERLLALAAERGERGCGHIIQEAVAFYLEQRERPAVVRVAPQPLVIEVPRAETRAERLRLVRGWVREEVEGLAALARGLRARLRRQAPQAA